MQNIYKCRWDLAVQSVAHCPLSSHDGCLLIITSFKTLYITWFISHRDITNPCWKITYILIKKNMSHWLKNSINIYINCTGNAISEINYIQTGSTIIGNFLNVRCGQSKPYQIWLCVWHLFVKVHIVDLEWNMATLFSIIRHDIIHWKYLHTVVLYD